MIEPVAIEPVCSICHGPIDAIPAPVRAEAYLTDTAVGYAWGI